MKHQKVQREFSPLRRRRTLVMGLNDSSPVLSLCNCNGLEQQPFRAGHLAATRYLRYETREPLCFVIPCVTLIYKPTSSRHPLKPTCTEREDHLKRELLLIKELRVFPMPMTTVPGAKNSVAQ